MHKSTKTTAYDRLCSAVKSRNEAGIARAAVDLTVVGLVYTAELTGHYDRVSRSLERNSSLLSVRKHQFKRPTERHCGRSGDELRRLNEDIDFLSEEVRILNRIHAVLGNELRRRGVLVTAVVPERPAAVRVHA